MLFYVCQSSCVALDVVSETAAFCWKQVCRESSPWKTCPGQLGHARQIHSLKLNDLQRLPRVCTSLSKSHLSHTQSGNGAISARSAINPVAKCALSSFKAIRIMRFAVAVLVSALSVPTGFLCGRSTSRGHHSRDPRQRQSQVRGPSRRPVHAARSRGARGPVVSGIGDGPALPCRPLPSAVKLVGARSADPRSGRYADSSDDTQHSG